MTGARRASAGYPPPPVVPIRSIKSWLPLLAVALGAVLPFVGSLQAGLLNWDDDLLLLLNDRYRTLSADNLAWMFGETFMGHYQPLTWLTYWLDHAVFGLDPFGFHLANLLWHGANGAACYWLLRQLQPAQAARWLCALAALLFAVHPLRVESVAWVTERRDLTAGLFWLLTVALYLRASREGAPHRRRDLILLHVTLVLSMLSKAWGITLPFVLLALDIWPLRRRHLSNARLLLEKLPMLVIVAVFAGIALFAQGSAGARLGFEVHTLAERCGQAAYGLVFYAAKTVAPFSLSPLYPLEGDVVLTEPRIFFSIALVVAAIVALFVLRRRAPGLAVAAVVYAAVLLPVLGFAQSGPQLVADRYSYLACLVFPAAIVLWPPVLRHRGRTVAVLATIVVALAVLTARQTAVWHDSITLWEHTLALQPDSFNAHLNYGRALADRQQPERALAEFRRTVELCPHEDQALIRIAAAEFAAGNHQLSFDAYQRAHRAAPGKPEYLHGMAAAALVLGRHAEAVQYCQQCLEVQRSYPHVWAILGDALRELGNQPDARRAYGFALRVNPADADVRRKYEALGGR